MRVESGRISKGSDGALGWIHSLDSAINGPPEQTQRQKKRPLTVEQVTAQAKAAYRHRKAKDVRAALSDELGVTRKALQALRVGYGCDHDGREWSAWPCRDGNCRIVGISRRYADGSKRTVQGTRAGLYYAPEWAALDGPVLIVEGGSDAAAAFDVGLKAIGRPSNTGGVSWIKHMLGGGRSIVIGERDESPDRRGRVSSCPVDCSGCGVCWPGLFGARAVAKQLGCEWVLPPEGCKDFRETVRLGKEVWWDMIRACR